MRPKQQTQFDQSSLGLHVCFEKRQKKAHLLQCLEVQKFEVSGAEKQSNVNLSYQPYYSKRIKKDTSRLKRG